MHRSRLGGFIIDCKDADLDTAATFWGSVLGLARQPSDKPEDKTYVVFEPGPAGLDIEVQKVAHDSRVHLDIETDDVESEVKRLEALGAKRVKFLHDWWVMQAPTGHRFCVVPARSADFDRKANIWR